MPLPTVMLSRSRSVSGFWLVSSMVGASFLRSRLGWSGACRRCFSLMVGDLCSKSGFGLLGGCLWSLWHQCWIMDFRDGAHKLSHCIVAIGNLGLQLLWYFLQITVSTWNSILAMGNFFESYFISYGVLKKYKSLHLGKLRYLAIVIESEDAHQTSKVVKLLQWLDSIGVKNVCLYDMNGVLKKSKEAIFQKLKNAKSIEEVNEAVAHHVPDHMTLEFVSYVDGKEAVAKAANLIFMENLKRHNLGGELDGQILLEPHLNEALQIVGSKGPEPDLLLVYGPVRSHLGFPAWRIRYTEIIHMGSLNFMRYGSLIKAIYNFTEVRQNFGT